MGKASTPTFVTELELVVSSEIERELLARFQAARQLYNACLSESITRLRLVKNSELYREARQIDRSKKAARIKAFKVARSAYRYSEYSLHSFSNQIAKSSKWIKTQLDSSTIQTIATRAFRASEKVLLGRAKKVRFKVPSRFRSVENKTNQFGLRWKNNQLVWSDLKINPRIDWSNPVLVHGLKNRVKYCRLLYRFLNGKRRWYVQLVNEGQPYQKPNNYTSEGVVGIDLNVSTVAVVGDHYAELAPFCLKVEDLQREVNALQRQMSRSQRSNNPDNFEPDFETQKGRKIVKKKGKVKKGVKKWNKSKRYKKLQVKLTELNRKQSAYRKSEQRQLVNRVLRHGNRINMENVSVKAWQKIWGKSIKVKSPGFFQSELCRKAESAGAIAIKFPTRNTKLSQTCICGRQVKKPLSQRVHSCECGVKTHRDLMSGYLARYIQSGELCLQSARDGWLGAELRLETAWQRYEQTMTEQVSESESRNSDYPLEVIVSNLANNNQTETNGYTDVIR